MHVHDDRVDGGVRCVFMMTALTTLDSASVLEAGLGVNGQEKSVNSVPCGQGETGGRNAAPPQPEGGSLFQRAPFQDVVGTCGGVLDVPGCAGAAKPSTAPGTNTNWATVFWRTV